MSAATLCMLLAAAGSLSADEPDWWQAQQEVHAMLAGGGNSFAEVVRQVTAKPPSSGHEAMVKLAVLTRGRMTGQAIEALDELKRLMPGLGAHQVGNIYYAATDDARDWDLARATVETFAGNLRELSLDTRLLRHWEESGWTYQQVDAWLADKPAGIDGFWLKQRMAHAARHDKAAVLAAELTAAVRREPGDIDGLLVFLDVLVAGRRTGREKWELAWIGKEVKPEPATKAYELGRRLQRLDEHELAVQFFLQTLGIPLSDAETSELGMSNQMVMPPEQLKAMFAVSVREALAESMLKLEQPDGAQRWMLEAADIRKECGLGMSALLAGQVQGASGRHVIEDRIREQEPASRDDPGYWRERAEYYLGRNEPAPEEEAWKKGLALTKPMPAADRPAKGAVDQRQWMLGGYARFLIRQERVPDAVALLRRELEQAPAGAESARGAARLLAFDLQPQVRADDEVLWTYLKNRGKWEHVEQRLLWRMLESAARDRLEGCLTRAAKLAAGSHPSRPFTLGRIMNRMGFAAASIPLLQDAAGRADDQDLKQSATFTLLESFLAAGDWQRAERIFPGASSRLTPREAPEWLGRVAVKAAQAGAKADAMRIWKRVTTLNPAEISGLESLARAGLRGELTAYYRAMEQSLPGSQVPAEALSIIAGDG